MIFNLKAKRDSNVPENNSPEVAIPSEELDQDQDLDPEISINPVVPVRNDDEIQGIELGEFSKRHEISKQDIWKRIKNGDLLARTENGFVYVYGNVDPEETLASLVRSENVSLPPVPALSESVTLVATEDHGAEVALLLDQLNAAKQDNRDLLQVTQNSVAKIVAMSEQIIRAKDHQLADKEEVVSTKQKHIELLEQQILDQKEKNRKLSQDLEDMQMLTNTLAGEPS